MKDGITKYPQFTLTYKEPNGSTVYDYFYNWKYKNETHDVTDIFTDAHGNEYRRKLYSGVECLAVNAEAFDAGSPKPAQFTAKLSPYRITFVK